MTPEEFEKWYEFVNDYKLRDASYTGLVEAPAEIAQLKAELETEKRHRVEDDRVLHQSCARIEQLEALATELADAFADTFNALLQVADVDYEGDSPEDSTEWKLITRARKEVGKTP